MFAVAASRLVRQRAGGGGGATVADVHGELVSHSSNPFLHGFLN